MAKIAKCTARLAGTDPSTNHIRKGDVYDDRHPLVESHPHLFVSADEFSAERNKSRSLSPAAKQRFRPASAGTETARSAPSEVRQVGFDCPESDCTRRFTSEEALNKHIGRTHRRK